MNDEHAKTLRMISRLIVLTSIAIFYIVVSGEDDNKYRLSMAELESLDEFDFSLQAEFVRNFIGVARQVALVNNYMNSLLTDISAKSKLIVEGDSKYLGQFEPVPILQVPDADASLSTIRNYLKAYIDGRHAVMLKLPNYDILRSMLAIDLLHSPVPNLAKQKVSKLVLNGFTAKFNWVTQLYSVTIIFTVPNTLRNNYDGYGGYFAFEVPSAIYGEPLVSADGVANYWDAVLRQRNLVDAAGTLLPQIGGTWSEISHLSREEALSLLARRIRETETTVNVFGFSLNELTAIVYLPAINLALLIYLFAHLRHLRACLSEEGGDHFRTFPWLPLSPDKLSRAVGYLITPGFPVSVNLLVLSEFWTETSEFGRLPQIVCGAVIIVAIFVYFESRKLTR